MTRAHARGHDQHVVSRAHSTIATAMAHESRSLGFGNIFRWRRMKIRRQISHERHVVRHVCMSDLLATADAERGADWLAKLSYKLARRDVSSGKAMSRRHGAMRLLDHAHIVRRVDNDRILVDFISGF